MMKVRAAAIDLENETFAAREALTEDSCGQVTSTMSIKKERNGLG